MRFFSAKYNKSYFGFSYVEAILTVIITLFISTSIAYAVVRAQNIQQSLFIKEQAIKALKKYTDEYRALVAYGERPLPGKQPRFGHDVVLFDPSEELTRITWGNNEGIIDAKLYHIITDKSYLSAGDQSGYFNIKTWIEWTDPYRGKPTKKHLAVEVDQAIFRKN